MTTLKTPFDAKQQIQKEAKEAQASKLRQLGQVGNLKHARQAERAKPKYGGTRYAKGGRVALATGGIGTGVPEGGAARPRIGRGKKVAPKGHGTTNIAIHMNPGAGAAPMGPGAGPPLIHPAMAAAVPPVMPHPAMAAGPPMGGPPMGGPPGMMPKPPGMAADGGAMRYARGGKIRKKHHGDGNDATHVKRISGKAGGTHEHMKGSTDDAEKYKKEMYGRGEQYAEDDGYAHGGHVHHHKEHHKHGHKHGHDHDHDHDHGHKHGEHHEHEHHHVHLKRGGEAHEHREKRAHGGYVSKVPVGSKEAGKAMHEMYGRHGKPYHDPSDDHPGNAKTHVDDRFTHTEPGHTRHRYEHEKNFAHGGHVSKEIRREAREEHESVAEEEREHHHHKRAHGGHVGEEKMKPREANEEHDEDIHIRGTGRGEGKEVEDGSEKHFGRARGGVVPKPGNPNPPPPHVHHPHMSAGASSGVGILEKQGKTVSPIRHDSNVGPWKKPKE